MTDAAGGVIAPARAAQSFVIKDNMCNE